MEPTDTGERPREEKEVLLHDLRSCDWNQLLPHLAKLRLPALLNPIRGEEGWDRTPEVLADLANRVITAIEDPKNPVVGIVGAPRMGKTSLLYSCEQELGGRPNCLYVDLQSFENPGSFLEQLKEELSKIKTVIFDEYNNRFGPLLEEMRRRGIKVIIAMSIQEAARLEESTRGAEFPLYRVPPVPDEQMSEYLRRLLELTDKSIPGSDKPIGVIAKLSGGSLVVANSIVSAFVLEARWNTSELTKELTEQDLNRIIQQGLRGLSNIFETWREIRANNPSFAKLIPNTTLAETFLPTET